MLIQIISVIVALLSEFIYLKIKKDKPVKAMLFTFVFSVIISCTLYFSTNVIEYITYFAVLSILNMCSINDVIRQESDNLFPVLILICGLFTPSSLIYRIISFAFITIVFLLIIVFSKNTIGGGDIKMICALSFFWGLEITVTALIISCISGILFGIIVKVIAKLPDFNKHFAFLPFVEVGYIIALLMQLY